MYSFYKIINRIAKSKTYWLPIDTFSVPDIQDNDDHLIILDLLDHPVITLANAPAGASF